MQADAITGTTQKPPLVILAGPTAVGKTELSLALAKAIDGEIISADSMQVYRRMDIGTAKLPPEMRQGIPHHLIDVCEPEEPYHVMRFQQEATACVRDILNRGKIPLVVGGTGFYIQALLYDIHFTALEDDGTIRTSLETALAKEGPVTLHQRLAQADPLAAAAIHPNNTKRVIRALEYYILTGEPISAHNQRERERSSPYHFAYFVLTMDRERLYQRIDARVDDMMEHGLLREVRSLLREGVSPSATSMQGLGYKELTAFLQGEISLEKAVNLIKQSSRHFAKRQLTWFRREREVIWLDVDECRAGEAVDSNALLDQVLTLLREQKIVGER